MIFLKIYGVRPTVSNGYLGGWKDNFNGEDINFFPKTPIDYSFRVNVNADRSLYLSNYYQSDWNTLIDKQLNDHPYNLKVFYLCECF